MTKLFSLPSIINSNPVIPSAVDITNGQTITNYSKATTSSLTSELSSKLSSQGTASSFSNISSQVSLSEVNGKIISKVVGTNETLITLGDVQLDSIPAGTVPSGDDDLTPTQKVIISSEPVLSDFGSTIIFDAMPSIDENRSANYRGFTPIQHPGEILKYEGTSARTFSVNVKLFSRTVTEATENLKKINIIRSWVMPFYGQGTADDSATAAFLGAPPPVLTLSAYGYQMIGPVKCVLESYQWTWPNDVDWIHTYSENGDVVPFPVIITLSLSLKETWSPREFSNFNLAAYRYGDLNEAFGGATNSNSSSSGFNTPGIRPENIDTSELKTISATTSSMVSESHSVISSVKTTVTSSAKTTVSQVQAIKSISNVVKSI